MLVFYSFFVFFCDELSSNDDEYSNTEAKRASSSVRLETIGEFRGLNGVPTTVDLSFAAATPHRSA